MSKYANLKTLYFFHKQHKTKIFLFVLFSILASGVVLAMPFISSQLLINLTGAKYKTMIWFALALFGTILASIGFGAVADYFHAKTSNALYFNIRRSVTSKIISMSLSTIYEKGSGFFLERLAEDSREASTVLLSISKAFIEIFINLSFLGYITVLNPLLGVVFASGVVIIIILEYFRVSRLLINKKKTKRMVERVKANETEILKGIKEIKGLNARDAILDKHSNISTKFIDTRYMREIFEVKMYSAITFVKAVTDLAVLLFAGLYLLPRDQTLLAAVLVIYSYKGNIYGLVASLANIKDQYVNGELNAKRLNDILLAPEDETDVFGIKNLESEIETIEFKNVFFEYTNDKKILKGIDFFIDSPGVYGFVGKSGSGKSTIFSLLSCFYKPTGGDIFINGTELSGLTEYAVKSQITPVLQDPYIFNDTIKNNILFAKSNATDEEIYNACKQAQIYDEILAMTDGFNTVVGEGGSTISGGQKQRLEIARALLKDTKVLLFDEATSALDKNNLNKINDLLISLGKTKIIFVIAHRLGIMRRCDRVVVLDEGKIIACGHHEELLKTNPYYMDLFNRSTNTEIKNS